MRNISPVATPNASLKSCTHKDSTNLLQRAEEGGCIPLVDITTNGFPNLEIAVDRLGEYLEQGKGFDAGYDTSVAVMDQTIGAVQRVVGTVRDADGYPPVTR